MRLPAIARRLVIAALVLAAPLWAGSGGTETSPLYRGLQVTARAHAFSLVGWEAAALADKARQTLKPDWSPGANPAADRQLVERYCDLTGQIDQLGAERDRVEATEAEPARSADLTRLSDEAAKLAAERGGIRRSVEEVIAWQVDQVLAEEGILRGLVSFEPQAGFPFVSASLTPSVAFHLGPLPDLIVISPRDRIELLRSVLVDPDIGFDEVNRLESATDRLGVASLVTPIGGLAAYPSMIPAGSSVEYTLMTVSHEWVHQYLTFRPLGQAYFSGYEMRTINETVADTVGRELGGLVYQRYYAQPTAAPAEPPDGAVSQPRPSFGDRMRGIRVEVERYLARGDVAGAEAYMSQEQKALAAEGWYVRRLNTAYLSFFGAYAGSANPYEAKLTALRARSGSLRAFLEAAAGLRSPDDLNRSGGTP